MATGPVISKSARRSMARSSAKLAGQSTVIFGMPDKNTVSITP